MINIYYKKDSAFPWAIIDVEASYSSQTYSRNLQKAIDTHIQNGSVLGPKTFKHYFKKFEPHLLLSVETLDNLKETRPELFL